jgi:hypothetical protein
VDCRVCKFPKDVDDFYIVKGFRRKDCKKCHNRTVHEYAKKRIERQKKKAVAHLGGKCQKCGYDRCLQALEFNHRDPSLKQFDISQATQAEVKWAVLVEELDKCDLLCANCHRELHYLST